MLTIFRLITLPFHASSQPNNSLERHILLKIKQFWSHPPSINHWSAAESSDHCTWPEITCKENSVTGLNLSSKDVTGKIPPFICDLKHLTILDFSNNSIVGSFPTGLYNCINLWHLDLSDNYFVGIIPGVVDKLSHLSFLNLGGKWETTSQEMFQLLSGVFRSL
ncbi:hypothetical protein POM88_024401 [Heracleum sosnowskyi]|uniref:Leucine-rich repeat-containing N-terminal plant-type domain-containing protein n=1 Tax=Heracleum sosnowskyi TaxID=360622 RepID=A0AAD8MLX1_9APIA|nr:hypothetical protein POM88_024401 [Heracleum sosnowskyi]